MSGGYNPYTQANQDPYKNTLYSTVPNKGFFSKLLKGLSNWGLNYDDMVVKNSVAVNAYEDPQQIGSNYAGMFDLFSRRATAMMAQSQPLASLDPRYQDKQRILREYSIKDEIRDFVSIVADTSICYDQGKMFCNLADMGNEFQPSIKAELQETFNKLYHRFKFHDGITAWNYFKDFLIEGYLAFEIVYDDKLKSVVGFNKLEPSSLTYAIEPMSGKKVWIQYPESQQYRRILLDSQIIYIAYSSSSDYNETSYVEPLIRPYNQLKLLQQTRIMFNLMNATIHKKFVIPTDGMPRAKAEQEIATLIADYKDDVVWDDTLGIVSMDGQPHPPYSKEYWFPKDANGSPDMEFIAPQGHDLNESDMLTWFYNILKRASRIPFNRFDKDNGGGNIYFEGGENTYDNNSYNNFIARLRAIFREIIIKPLFIQMVLTYPELKDDENFRNVINIIYCGDDELEKARQLNNYKNRADIASTILSTFQTTDASGATKPYFHMEWVVRKILGMTEAELEENKKYWKMYPDEGGGATGEGGGGGEGGLPDMSGGGGGDEFSDTGEPVQGEPVQGETPAQGAQTQTAQGSTQPTAQTPQAQESV